MQDGRAANRQIPLSAIWRSVFVLFAIGLRSLNDLEHFLRRTGSRRIGSRTPSADTIAYAMRRVEPHEVRSVLHEVNREVLRKKAVVVDDPGWGLGLVVAMDGHEYCSSRRRCWHGCSVRSVDTKDGRVPEFYQRGVVCQIVGATPPLLLDFEMQEGKEGEITAARRLTERVLDVYGRRIAVVTLDGLYVDTQLIEMIRHRGIEVVVALKNEQLHAYQELEALSAVSPPVRCEEGVGKVTQYWDFGGISVGGIREPARVVRVLRSSNHPPRSPGRINRHQGTPDRTQDRRYLVYGSMSTRLVDRIGHLRWEVENRGFHELATYHRLNHCFVHDPRAIQNFLAILILAFTMVRLFFERNVKQPQMRHATHLAQRGALRESVGSQAGCLPPAPT